MCIFTKFHAYLVVSAHAKNKMKLKSAIKSCFLLTLPSFRRIYRCGLLNDLRQKSTVCFRRYTRRVERTVEYFIFFFRPRRTRLTTISKPTGVNSFLKILYKQNNRDAHAVSRALASISSSDERNSIVTHTHTHARVPIESDGKTSVHGSESPLFVNRDQVAVLDSSSVRLVLFRAALPDANRTVRATISQRFRAGTRVVFVTYAFVLFPRQLTTTFPRAWRITKNEKKKKNTKESRSQPDVFGPFRYNSRSRGGWKFARVKGHADPRGAL